MKIEYRRGNFLVVSSTAKMPQSCYGKYRNVAILQFDGVNFPQQIHPRHSSVIEICYYEGKLFDGKTDACAYRKAVIRAIDLLERGLVR